jgi:hypothetical protein
LASALRTARKLEGDEVIVREMVIPRQCEPKFVDMIKDEADKYDVILSMGCGAGVQGIAERIINIPVLPALNTTFIGLADSIFEVCAACGDCILSRQEYVQWQGVRKVLSTAPAVDHAAECVKFQKITPAYGN